MTLEDFQEWAQEHKILSIFLVLLIVFFVIGNIFMVNNGSIKTKSKTIKSDITKTYNIGETFIIDNIAYRVNNIDKTTELGDWWITEPQGVFYVVEITVENIGKETKEYFSPPDIEIIDSLGRHFNVDKDARWRGESLFWEQLHPNMEKTGNYIFDLPKDSSGLRLKFSKGFFDKKIIYINLGR